MRNLQYWSYFSNISIRFSKVSISSETAISLRSGKLFKPFTISTHNFTTKKKHLKGFLDWRVGLYIKSGATAVANYQRILLTFDYHSHESSHLWCWHHSPQQELIKQKREMIISLYIKETTYQDIKLHELSISIKFIHICESIPALKLTICTLINQSLSKIVIFWSVILS